LASRLLIENPTVVNRIIIIIIIIIIGTRRASFPSGFHGNPSANNPYPTAVRAIKRYQR
jgi:hypothetical protein